jgi:hypothetical protein
MVTSGVQHFYRFKRILILAVLSIFIIAGCGKAKNVKWVFYDETYCADKWEKSLNNERLKQNVTDYLEKKNIKVFEMEIFSDRTPDACQDCACKSGRRIKCKVKRSDVSDVKREGFYE